MESTSLASSPPPKRLKSESGSKPNSPSVIADTIFGSMTPVDADQKGELMRLREENAKLRDIVNTIRKCTDLIV